MNKRERYAITTIFFRPPAPSTHNRNPALFKGAAVSPCSSPFLGFLCLRPRQNINSLRCWLSVSSSVHLSIRPLLIPQLPCRFRRCRSSSSDGCAIRPITPLSHPSVQLRLLPNTTTHHILHPLSSFVRSLVRSVGLGMNGVGNDRSFPLSSFTLRRR